MTVAIIPARGGSKRIPRKNLSAFCGQPIISYSIRAAIESHCFERILVTTDDAEIANLATDLGAEVPFTRPANLADDFATTVDVIGHAVEWLATTGYPFEYACCIYATAPLISSKDLQVAFDRLKSTSFDYVFPAATFPYSIYRAITRSSTGVVSLIFPEHVHTRSQDLPDAWHDSGQFYWGRKSAWRDRTPIISPASTTIEIARSRVQDIDTPEDWHQAELLYEALTRPRASS